MVEVIQGVQGRLMWATDDYMDLCVDRVLNFGRYLVFPSSHYFKSKLLCFKQLMKKGRTGIYRRTAHHTVPL